MAQMTNQQILEQAIQKNIDDGLAPFDYGSPTHGFDVFWEEEENSWVYSPYYNSSKGHKYFAIGELVFNHDFAKALWGEDRGTYRANVNTPFETDERMDEPAWEFHLKRMVLAEDPIKYLGEHL